jgi:hypothetical protein
LLLLLLLSASQTNFDFFSAFQYTKIFNNFQFTHADFKKREREKEKLISIESGHARLLIVIHLNQQIRLGEKVIR